MTRYPRPFQHHMNGEHMNGSRTDGSDTTTRDGRDGQRRRQAPLFERVRTPGPLA